MRRRELALWAWISIAALPARAIDAVNPPGDAPTFKEGKAGTPAILTFSPTQLSIPTLLGAIVPSDSIANATYALDARRPAHEVHAPLRTDRLEVLEPVAAAIRKRGARDADRLIDLARELHDISPTTGLPNRAHFFARVAAALKSVLHPAVAMLDMNNFGAVNVGLAEAFGSVTEGRKRADQILALAGATLQALAERYQVTVHHLSGEEFVVSGSHNNVLAMCAAARSTLTPGRLLDAAGIVHGTAEREEIEAAMERLGRGRQPVGDFTYGVAPLDGRSLAEAVQAADQALGLAKENGRRGYIAHEFPEGYREWTPPSSVTFGREDLPDPRLPRTAEIFADLMANLTPSERQLLQRSAFVDPLTQARTYDFIQTQAPAWDQFYALKKTIERTVVRKRKVEKVKMRKQGKVALISARNLKQINDVLGHEAGDLYLRKLGVILRQEIARARAEGLDVQEPVRVSAKEFLLVGLDADVVAQRVAREVARSFNHGRLLAGAKVREVRRESIKRQTVPAKRAKLIGSMRVVAEPIVFNGRADSLAALDRAVERLEDYKRAEGAVAIRP